jgi:hypothetical protein
MHPFSYSKNIIWQIYCPNNASFAAFVPGDLHKKERSRVPALTLSLSVIF